MSYCVILHLEAIFRELAEVGRQLSLHINTEHHSDTTSCRDHQGEAFHLLGQDEHGEEGGGGPAEGGELLVDPHHQAGVSQKVRILPQPAM